MNRDDVFPSELSIPGEVGKVAARYRELARMDVEEMPDIDSLTSREKFVLVENLTAEMLHKHVVVLTELIEMRRKYA